MRWGKGFRARYRNWRYRFARGPVRYPPPGSSWDLPEIELPAHQALFRICRVIHADPAFFGRTLTQRFDDPDMSYGVCYFGTTLDCCLAETIPIRIDRRTLEGAIAVQTLRQYYAAVATPNRPLKLARLVGDGLQRLDIDLRVTGGNDLRVSRAWSKAIHNHPRAVDGLLYTSRHRNDLYSVALFERAESAVSFSVWGTLGDPTIPSLWTETNRILDERRVSLLS